MHRNQHSCMDFFCEDHRFFCSHISDDIITEFIITTPIYRNHAHICVLYPFGKPIVYAAISGMIYRQVSHKNPVSKLPVISVFVLMQFFMGSRHRRNTASV